MSELKPYAEYKDSRVDWLGDIPSSWNAVPLRYLSDIETGSKDTINAEPNGKFPFFVRSPDILAIDSYTYDCEAILTPGDGDVGKIFHHVDEKFDVHQRVYVLRNFNKKVNGRYLFHYFSSQFGQVVFYGGAKSTVASLRRPMFTSFPVAVPPISEQRAIASFLDHETAEIDAFIGDQEELIGLLKERRAATITQSVTKGLDVDPAVKESSLGWQRLVNANWAVVPIKVAGKVTLGKMLQSEQKIESDELRTYMRAANVQPHGLELADQQRMWFSTREVSSLDLRSGDVVVVEGGAGFGRSAYLTHDLDGWAFQNSINRIRPAKSCDGRYVNYVLKSIYASGYMDIVCNKATIPHLTAEKLEALRVPLPSHSEQKEIANYLDRETAEIDAAIADAKEAIELSKERRTALISAAVTGKIDVRNHTAVKGNTK